MKSVWFFRPILITFLIILAGCASSKFYFRGEGSELLTQVDELPSQWELERTWESSLKNATQWTRIYAIPNVSGRQIGFSIAVFSNEKDAIAFWDLFYQRLEATQTCSSLPESFAYKSYLADQFEMICSDNIWDEVAYEYFILARYGNVISTLDAAVVKNKDSSASEVGVLTWSEMETLLKKIDEKFQQASLNSR